MFLQHKYQQKPRQWGPYNTVKAAFAQRLNMPLPTMFCPLWEVAGKFWDLMFAGESGAFSGMLSWCGDGIYVKNNALPSYATVPQAFSAADNTPWTVAITLSTQSTSQSKAIIAAYNNNTSYGYLARYPGAKFRIRLSSAVDFTAITDFSRPTTIVITCDGATTGTIRAYQDGDLRGSSSQSNTAFDLDMIGINSNTYCAEDDVVYQISAWNTELSSDEVKRFSDGLWEFLHPVVLDTYFGAFDATQLPIIITPLYTINQVAQGDQL